MFSMLISGVLATLLAAAPDPAPASLAAAERAFAADARRDGTRRAFLAHFDAGSWLFRPAPVDALGALARDEDASGELAWAPARFAVAASGDLGFSTGPWRATGPGSDGAAHGQFLTVWVRNGDGVWRVKADGGIGHAAPLDAPSGALPVATDASVVALAGDEAARVGELASADDALRAELAGTRPAQAWSAVADPALHVLRNGEPPADGPAALALLARDPRGFGTGERRAIGIAASGELGYTLGGSSACAPCGSYLRVWRRHDSGWKLLADVGMPHR
jgi:ketosteroid isomerase-like protein